MAEPIIFYDVPRTVDSGEAWSPNTWKTRYTLNMKGIPYKSVWVEYPDIASVMRRIGANPTAQKNGSPHYTLPAIYDPNTKMALADSAQIVRYLDNRYPDTPRLIPVGTDALHAAFDQAFLSVLLSDIQPIMLPPTANNLPPRSAAYFTATREVSMGGKLDELAPPGPKREKYWSGIQEALHKYAQWLQADGVDKLFFTGDKIVYADITIASFLMWMRTILGPNNHEWVAVETWDGGRWARFMEAFNAYDAVDAGENAVV
ncbi:hypothetical protein BV20DRAFT_1051003 [Pilatotrama ljubarskyi]|nr:hypothetical protein BV20DRAFT_1051003 [Pilatotrama ljubarskyi]